MSIKQPSTAEKKLVTVAALAAIVCFFLPWANWAGVSIAAKDMANGNFFTVTESNYAIANPFPSMVWANAIFWLIPALSFVSILFVMLRKTYAGWYAAIAGAFILGLATVYACFTNELKVFNDSIKLPNSLQAAWYISVLAALILIMLGWPKKILLKLLLLILPVAIALGAFTQIKQSQMNENVDKTSALKSDYSVMADALIKEFLVSDSVANLKYINKIVEVTGIISELNCTDTTATLNFADSTGSYTIFDFEKEQVPAVKRLQVGNKVTVKALCSGGIYSDLLESETISFKHAILKP